MASAGERARIALMASTSSPVGQLTKDVQRATVLLGRRVGLRSGLHVQQGIPASCRAPPCLHIGLGRVFVFEFHTIARVMLVRSPGCERARSRRLAAAMPWLLRWIPCKAVLPNC